MILNLGQKQTDIKFLDTLTSNDFKLNNNNNNRLFSPDIRMMDNTHQFMGDNNGYNLDIRRTVPSKKNISNFDPTSAIQDHNQFLEDTNDDIRLDNINHNLIEVTSVPEVRVDLESDRPQKIYQFENKFVKNVSSLRNSSILMKVNQPNGVRIQNNFMPNLQSSFNPNARFQINNLDQNGEIFSQTSPEGFTLGRPQSNQLSSTLKSKKNKTSSKSKRQTETLTSNSKDQSRQRNITLSSYDQKSFSKERQKTGSSLPKSVRFVDCIDVSQISNKTKSINLKSILRNASPKNQSRRYNSFQNNTHRHRSRSSGGFSHSPIVTTYRSRGSSSRKINQNRNIYGLNHNVSRISERNESSRMNESKSSNLKNLSRFQTIIPKNIIQKITKTPFKSTSKGKTIILNDSHLPNNLRKISGNALISKSVNRIRQERSSRRIPIKTKIIPTPTSMLTNSGHDTKRSNFAYSVNKENRVREVKKNLNPFQNTIVSTQQSVQKRFNPSFKIVNDNSVRINSHLVRPSTLNRKVQIKDYDKFKPRQNNTIKSSKYISKISNSNKRKYNSGRLEW